MKWKIKKPKPLMKRFISLVFTLSITSIIWGGLTGSFFGTSADFNTKLSDFTFLNHIVEKKASYHLDQKDDVYKYWLNKYPSISSAQNGKEFINICKTEKDGKQLFEVLDTFKNNILMELSLLIGAIHICLSFIRNQYV